MNRDLKFAVLWRGVLVRQKIISLLSVKEPLSSSSYAQGESEKNKLLWVSLEHLIMRLCISKNTEHSQQATPEQQQCFFFVDCFRDLAHYFFVRKRCEIIGHKLAEKSVSVMRKQSRTWELLKIQCDLSQRQHQQNKPLLFTRCPAASFFPSSLFFPPPSYHIFFTFDALCQLFCFSLLHWAEFIFHELHIRHYDSEQRNFPDRADSVALSHFKKRTVGVSALCVRISHFLLFVFVCVPQSFPSVLLLSLLILVIFSQQKLQNLKPISLVSMPSTHTAFFQPYSWIIHIQYILVVSTWIKEAGKENQAHKWASCP